MHLLNSRILLAAALVVNLCMHFSAHGAIKESELEQIVHQALKEFYTPGMAIGIVHKQKVVLAKGFGTANINNNQSVTAHTYFRLASLSKAFTASGLAILVDQGKANWHDKVIEHLPQFALYDPYVTQEFTLIDLLTHKSGLVSGAGDSMIWPEPSGFSRDEVIHSLRYLTSEYGFRDTYAYSNVMYITAGEVIASISGLSFAEFVERHIFAPLGMDCYAGDMPKEHVDKSAMAYAHNDEKGIYAVTRNSIGETGLMSAAAGGIVCNAHSMNKWLLALLEPEKLPFSVEQFNYMTKAHTILSVSKQEQEWDNTLFKHYGLGWRIGNIGQLKTISHTGTLSGYQAYIAFIPTLELGVVILNNGSNSAARGAIMQTITKAYMRAQGFKKQTKVDWIATFKQYLKQREKAYLDKLSIPQAEEPMIISAEDIIGDYDDKWFGRLSIVPLKDAPNQLMIYSHKMKTLKGAITPFEKTSFKIQWYNKNAASDAFMHFTIGASNDPDSNNTEANIIKAELHPFTRTNKINHAYRDMVFYKVEK